MRSELQVKVGLWLATKQQQPWERGINDCCTLFMEYHDHLMSDNALNGFKGKYNDLRSAIRWAKKFPKTHEWFPAHGYYQVTQPQTGDIAMIEQKWFPSSYIICQNTAWGISDNAKRMSRHVIQTPETEYSIWRHKSWD